MIELARSSVQTWECDQMGHMNVQFYVAHATAANAALASAIGVGPNYSRHHDVTFAPVDQHIRFLKELRPGAPFFVRGGVIAARDHSLRSYVELCHSLTGEPCATITTDSAFVERVTLKPRVLPAAALDKAEELKIALPDHGAPRGLTLTPPRPAPTLEEAARIGLVPTFQGVVLARDCSVDGFYDTAAYMGRVSDAIPNLIGAMRGEDRSRDNRVGGAALEYRFAFRKAARVGDVLALRSGLKSIGSKTYCWCHWMFDVDTGDAIATAEAVAVSLDLTTRRAIENPPELRAELERLIVPGLTI